MIRKPYILFVVTKSEFINVLAFINVLTLRTEKMQILMSKQFIIECKQFSNFTVVK